MHPLDALIVVAKRPAAGQTKTRLVPPLTSVEAAELYDCFLRDTLDLMRQVPQARPVIAYLPAGDDSFFAELAPDFERIPQEGNSLGERLDNAVSAVLRRGYRHVAIMNSDGPTLPPAYLHEAFAALEGEADIVLGPSEDGGYYLIGMKRPAPRLLREVVMSTPTVAADTLALARAEALRVHLLPVWYDVDDEAGLRRLCAEVLDATPDDAPRTRRFVARALLVR